MTDSVGSRATFAYKRNTGDWGAPTEVGAGDGRQYLTESLTPAIQLIEDEQISGDAQQREGDKGDKLFSGGIDFDAKYQGFEEFLAMALGTATKTQQGSSSAYLHRLTVNGDVQGEHVTLVFDKQVSLWEYPSAKIAGFTLSHQHGQKAKLQIQFIPFDLDDNSSTNTTGTFANVTIPDERDFLLFNQLACRINDASGDALDDDDKVYLMSYSVSFTRNFETDDITTQFGDRVDEPIGDGFVQCSGNLNFSKYQTLNDPVFQAHLAKTRKKMTLTYVGPEASNPYNYGFTLYFPNVQFSEGGAPVGGPGRIPLNTAFRSYAAAAAPTGFHSSFDDVLGAEIVNLNASTLLT